MCGGSPASHSVWNLRGGRGLSRGQQAGPPLSEGPDASIPLPPFQADFCLFLLQSELDLEKGLEMRKWVLSGILASEETYLSHLEALLLVRRVFRELSRAGWGRMTGLGSLFALKSQVSCQSLGAARHPWSGYQWKTELPNQAGFKIVFVM